MMRKTRLVDLLEGINATIPDSAQTLECTDVVADSRQVRKGAVFVALRGTKFDGLEFISDALERGASAVVADRKPQTSIPVPLILVPDARTAYAKMTSALFDHPSRKLKIGAVTGTNGKTTFTYLGAHLAKAVGAPSGIIGTTGYKFGDYSEQASHTTPEARTLQQLLARMVDESIEYVFAEFSSHALDQRRVDGIAIDVAVFTNLSRDHLDYHGSREEYFAAKRRLFTEILPTSAAVGKRAAAVIFVDDEAGARIAQELSKKSSSIDVYKVSLEDSSAEVFAKPEKIDMSGTQALIYTPSGRVRLNLKLVGRHNLVNALLAIATGLHFGWPLQVMTDALAQSIYIPGRLERIDNPIGIDVFVDYAHTDDALHKVLSALRPLVRKRLIVVMGCGGDRDKTKRAPMGKIAASMANVAVITSDNPRTEDPKAIIDDIVLGAQSSGAERLSDFREAAFKDGYVVELDRRKAIWEAITTIARSGDTVLIAGKGHEDYQIIGTKRIHFDDREEARRALKALEREGGAGLVQEKT